MHKETFFPLTDSPNEALSDPFFAQCIHFLFFKFQMIIPCVWLCLTL